MSIPGHFSAGVKVPVNGSSSVNAKVASTASSNLTSNTPSTTLHTSSTASTATNVNVSSTSNSSAAPATTNNINVNNATKGQATNAAMKFMFIFVFMIRCLKDIGLLGEEGLVLGPHRLNYGNKYLAKFYFKSNGRIDIFKKKIHGKEVSHDRVQPLLRLFGQGGGGGLYKFYIGCPPPPCPASLGSG